MSIVYSCVDISPRFEAYMLNIAKLTVVIVLVVHDEVQCIPL